MIAGTGVAVWQAHIATQQRDRAVNLATRSEAVSDFVALMVTEVADGTQPITIQQLIDRSESIATRSYVGNSSQQAAILEVLGNYHLSMGRPDRASMIFDKALSLAANNPDTILKARLFCLSAVAQFQTGHKELARQQMETGLAKSYQAPDVEAMCLEVRAYFKYEDNNLQLMLQDLELAQRELQRSGVNRPELAANLLSDMAGAHVDLGLTDDADKEYSRAIALLESMGRGETSTALQIQRNWSSAYEIVGNPLKALPHIDKAMESAYKRGGDATYVATTVVDRADVLHQLARNNEALIAYQQGLDNAHQHHDVLTEVHAKEGIIMALISLGRLNEAEAAIKGLGPMITEQLPNDREQSQQLISAKALLATKRRQYEKAIDGFSQNIEFFSSKDARPWSLSRRLILRGQTYFAMRDYSSALSDAARAYDLAKVAQMELTSSQITGGAALLLAKIHAAQNQNVEARQWTSIAVTQLQGSIGADHPDTIEAKQLLDRLGSNH